MWNPLVSVIIPAYNQADYLGNAIQSVLDQTYRDFEIIVVDDASPDNTQWVIKQFKDPRLRSIEHHINRHLAAARNTGIRASSGEIIALLDADDLYHPEKLKLHVEFLESNPTVGVTYNDRFEVDTSGQILNLWRPPKIANYSDLVMGFPFAPSDMVIRREWLFQVDLFDESYKYFSEDLDINCRLALSGCSFSNVGRALNYRRYYRERLIKNIPLRLAAALRALNKTFISPFL